ncbi:MAG: alginate export family protein [Cellvibrionaceae bacterium]|nr:alginate export family protein [Cellvibrionaceae bacterium]
MNKNLLSAAVCTCTIFGSVSVLANPTMEYASNLRYRYEYFDIDEAPGTSKASTARLAVSAKANLTSSFSAFADFEAVEQIFEDEYAVPFISDPKTAGYPTIADPQGAEVNQAYIAYNNPTYKTQVRIGRQEVMLNNGRFISISAWRQNHMSFNGATFSVSPSDAIKIDYGYLGRVLRVTGEEASNGRANMDSHFYNLAYSVKDVGVLKTYGVLLDFDTELVNSTDTFGASFEGNMPMGDMRFLATLDYAIQKDAEDNPREIDQNYYLVEAGVQISGISYLAGYNTLEASSATDKFITPLAHPHNGWTELFLNNPSLGDSHGLEAAYLSTTGKMPGTQNLFFTGFYYLYSPNTGSADYGSELDFSLEYKGIAKTLLGWRFAKYMADDLFEDALRTSIYVSYTF